MAKGNRRSKNFTTEDFQPVRNEESHRAMMDKRSSNAAGTHDSRPNRERTRSNAKRKAIKQDW